MAVGFQGLAKLHPVDGFRLGAVAAGIKKPNRLDLVVMEVAEGSRCACVFTRNRFRAAPVLVAERHLAGTTPRFILVNTGYANAGTGEQGLADAAACCDAVAALTGVPPASVLPFSTGVIGENLPVHRIRDGLPRALESLSETGWKDAANGIMTTDTAPKGASRQIELGGRQVTVTGIAKGAGMIRPDMATMLAFVATDADVLPELLDEALRHAVERSFNRITVDGDTSTNDACVLVATGKSPARAVIAKDSAYQRLVDAVTDVCIALAQSIVRDGEGATRFVTVDVRDGRTEDECRRVAYAVAQSPLVKTALFAADPNWGRILAAVGRAGLDDLNVEGVSVYLDDLLIAERGARASSYDESAAQTRMSKDEVTIVVRLGRGSAATTVWTCDFSYDYVRINADYRS